MTAISSEVTRSADRYADPMVREAGFFSPGRTWAGIAAGAVAGLAIGLLMTTLGAAIGLTAGAAVDAQTVGTEEAGTAAVGFGLSAGVWLIITAVVVGLVGGGVLAWMLGPERRLPRMLLGLVTWATGMVLVALLAAPGAGGLAGGLGGSAAALAGSDASLRVRSANTGVPALREDARTSAVPLTEAERARAAEAAENAAKAAATAAWFALVAQLVGLGATILMVGKRRYAVDEVRVGSAALAS